MHQIETPRRCHELQASVSMHPLCFHHRIYGRKHQSQSTPRHRTRPSENPTPPPRASHSLSYLPRCPPPSPCNTPSPPLAPTPPRAIATCTGSSLAMSIWCSQLASPPAPASSRSKAMPRHSACNPSTSSPHKKPSKPTPSTTPPPSAPKASRSSQTPSPSNEARLPCKKNGCLLPLVPSAQCLVPLFSPQHPLQPHHQHLQCAVRISQPRLAPLICLHARA